jgi:hypothetical protein
MKAILEFDLTDVEDKIEHLRCVTSSNMSMFIWDLVYRLRKEVENDIEFSKTDLSNYDVIELIYKKILDSLDEYHIDVDELN